MTMAPLTFLLVAATAAAYTVDRDYSIFVDSSGRQRLWHGVNFVEKSPPYYPIITEADIANLKSFGGYAVRLGVMMPGMFPYGPTLNTTYLDKIEEIVDTLHAANIETILDLHQDVLAPKICGEGTPDWMLNITDLHAMEFPRPAQITPIKIDPKTGHPESCAPTGHLKSIGWSMFYTTDQCGKAFQQLYDGGNTMAESFASYWAELAKRFRGHAGILAYELLNEPWVGDHVTHPSLLLETGKAEAEVGKYMQRMHDVVRAIDEHALILFSPAEVNNRLMRRVGYETGFLEGAGMAYHVYCLTGTDGDGPTTWYAKQLCHFNDGNQLKQRESDLKRLKTAGFVTEFGAVAPSITGIAEVEFVLDHFDAVQPPSSWAYWDYGELTRDKSKADKYLTVVARAYPRAVAGRISSMSFDSTNSTFKMQYEAFADGVTEIFLPLQRRYPHGYTVSTSPSVAVETTSDGIQLRAQTRGAVRVEIAAKACPEAIVV
eukprot:TRINITY_DN23774_c0_g1_i1.p1 TRINITY_DN23774_c0_g1~~TRINITY_DN23774_c0_g1_i1.p1  ORF type:complete len:489 (+),score=85.84 TRINITY_DN23774_c0_g1_i1:60-1526(+)